MFLMYVNFMTFFPPHNQYQNNIQCQSTHSFPGIQLLSLPVYIGRSDTKSKKLKYTDVIKRMCFGMGT